MHAAYGLSAGLSSKSLYRRCILAEVDRPGMNPDWSGAPDESLGVTNDLLEFYLRSYCPCSI